MPVKVADCFTDPPYNVGKDYGFYKDRISPTDYVEFMSEVFSELNRICNSVTIVTPHIHLRLYLTLLGADFNLVTCYHPAKNNFYKGFVSKSTLLLTNAKPEKKDQVSNLWKVELPGIGYYSKEVRTGHPGATTYALTEMVIQQLCRSTGVYDPFTGYGTTGIACLRNNKNFVGSEVDADAVAFAKKRIAENKPFKKNN